MSSNQKNKKQKLSRPPTKPGDRGKVKPTSESNRKTYIFLFLFAFLLYGNTIYHDYAYDDISVISLNQYTQMGAKGIPTLLSKSYWYGLTGKNESYYRPASLVMFAMEKELFGDNPHAGHLVNIILYGLTGIVLCSCLRRLFAWNKTLAPNAKLLSIVATLLFLAHPVHTEVIANIKSRDEILSFLFSILALRSIIRYDYTQKFIQLFWAMIFFLVAILSKESAIPFMLVVPLAAVIFRKADIKKCIRFTAPLIAALVVYFSLRAMFLDAMITGKEGAGVIDNSIAGATDMGERLATVFFILGKYLWLLIFPHPLMYTYSFNQVPLVGWTNPFAIISLLIYLSAFVYAVYSLFQMKKEGSPQSPVAFAILFFFITFALVSNLFFLIGVNMAERLIYTPSLGFCILLAWLIIKISKATDGKNQEKNYLFLSILIVLLGGYSIKTISRNSDWKNNSTLFTNDAGNASKSALAHRSYSNILFDQAKEETDSVKKNQLLKSALEEGKTAIGIYSKYADGYQTLGDIYGYNKDYADAIAAYKNVILYDPHYAPAYNNIGLVFDAVQQYDSALFYYQRGVEVDPRYWNAWYNMGLCLGKQGNLDKAIECFTTTIQVNPGFAKGYSNLGTAYAMKGDEENALDYYNQALSHDPNDATTSMNISLLYQKRGDIGRANEFREKANQLNQSLRK